MNWEQLPFLIYFLESFKYVSWTQCEVTGKKSLEAYSKEPFEGSEEIFLIDYFGDEDEAWSYINSNPDREDSILLKQFLSKKR